jgi:hypothetical protein
MSHRGDCYLVDAELESLMETDPIAAHERIMELTRPTLPTIVHEEYTGKQPALDSNGNGDEPPPFTDEQIDIVAAAMAELSHLCALNFRTRGTLPWRRGPRRSQFFKLK